MAFPSPYVLGVRVADVVHHIDTGFDPELADYKARFTRDVKRAEGLELTQGAVGFIKRLRPPR